MIVAELWAIIKPFTSPVCLLITAFLFLRILQRIYYLLKGHCHLWNYSPRAEIAKLWRRENIRVVECCAQSSSDGTIIHYQRIGSGEKVILHSNGVGTDFFLWLNFLQHLLQLDPHFFEKYTILAATHRGLFVPDKRKNKRVNVTLQNCATDVQDVMRHAGKPHTALPA